MRWMIGLLATLTFLAAPLRAQDFNDRDTKEIEAYRFSDAAFAKYSQATAKLGPVTRGVTCAADDGDGPSITRIVAKIESVPAAKAAIASAGLATREYVVFTLALVENALAAFTFEAGGQLPPGVDAGNVSFVRAHKADIEALNLGDTGCRDEEEEDDRDTGGDDKDK
jgi:hypothetical protein